MIRSNIEQLNRDLDDLKDGGSFLSHEYLRILAQRNMNRKCLHELERSNVNIGAKEWQGMKKKYKVPEWEDLSLRKFKRAVYKAQDFNAEEYDHHFYKDGKEIK